MAKLERVRRSSVRLCVLASVQLCLLALVFGGLLTDAVAAQRQSRKQNQEIGPVVRAYLGYLRAEQEVVDDRASRREVSRAYYRRNSNRIHALRRMAIRIARESGDDYLPELEAVTRDEFNNLFESPPPPQSFYAGQVLNNAYRFLGSTHSGETFYVFARLSTDEQAELVNKEAVSETNTSAPSAATTTGLREPEAVRPRKTQAP